MAMGASDCLDVYVRLVMVGKRLVVFSIAVGRNTYNGERGKLV